MPQGYENICSRCAPCADKKRMNYLERILGLDNLKRSGQIALVCSILCLAIFLMSRIIPFNRRTLVYINWYIFMPILIVGLYNSIYGLIELIKTKDFKPRILLALLPIPIYVSYLIIKIFII